MNRHTPTGPLALVSLCLALLAGCYMPAPVTHAVLAVSDGGAYLLDNTPVPGPELASALAAKRAAVPNLRVDLQVSPRAAMPAIEAAVAAAKQAQVKVDFTHDLSAEAVARLQAEAAVAPPR
jgi:hypothetical protein